VIVRKSALERSHADGVDGFVQRAIPNFVEDEHLIRVGFMSTGEALELIEALRVIALGDDDVALVQGDTAPAWIEVGTVEDHRCCWLRGEASGAVVIETRVVDILRTCGCTLESRSEPDTFRCLRGRAEVELQIFQNRPSAIHVVIGRRDVTRRSQLALDQTLLADVAKALDAAGARRL